MRLSSLQQHKTRQYALYMPTKNQNPKHTSEKLSFHEPKHTGGEQKCRLHIMGVFTVNIAPAVSLLLLQSYHPARKQVVALSLDTGS